MNVIKDLSIGKRLAIIICFAFVMIVITQMTVILNSRRLADEINRGYEAITLPLKAIANARGEFHAMRTALHNLTFDFNTGEQNQRFKEEALQNLSGYERNILEYKEILDNFGTNTPYEQEAVFYLYLMLAPLREYVEFIIPIAERTGYEADAIRILRGDFLDVAEDISLELLFLTDILEAQSHDANLRAEMLFRDTIILFLVAIAVCIVILTFSALIFARSVIQPLREVTDVALDLSNGNLDTADIEFQSKSELGILADSFRHMIRSLRARDVLVSGITYASIIQKNLLPLDSDFRKAFSDHSVKWEPRDIVGGDIYWMKTFEKGTVLCVCDCTGHGTPGALLTTLVVSALESVIWPSNCHDTAYIVWEIEKRLANIFSVHEKQDDDIKDGCDLAVLFIANDGSITLSSGHTDVFVCDGKDVTRYRGQKLYVGEGRIKSKDEIETVSIAPDPDNKFYIASDGLYDQPGGEQSIPFGYRRFERIILENHGEKQSDISAKVWETFETYRGAEPRVDDFELISFKP